MDDQSRGVADNGLDGLRGAAKSARGLCHGAPRSYFKYFTESVSTLVPNNVVAQPVSRVYQTDFCT